MSCPGVARKYDICTGHGCFPPRPNAMWSPDVFANDRNVHRQTDAWQPHCWGPVCHGGTLAKGSPIVLVNDLECARCGDPVTCGSFVMTCSPDVLAGG